MGRVGWKTTKMPAKSPCAPRVPAGWEQKENKGTGADEHDPTTHSDTRWFPIHHDPLPNRHALTQPEATTWATTSTPNPARTIDEVILLGEKVIKLAPECRRIAGRFLFLKAYCYFLTWLSSKLTKPGDILRIFVLPELSKESFFCRSITFNQKQIKLRLGG